MEIINKMQSFLTENAKLAYRSYSTDSFNVFIDTEKEFTYFNYAIPSKSIIYDFDKEYSKIAKIFNDKDRLVRFEFLEEFAPELSSLLLSVGLIEEYRVDFMTCTKNSFLDLTQVEDFSILILNDLSTPDILKQFRLIQEISFNDNCDLNLNMIDAKDVILNIGKGAGFIGFLKDTPVAACQYTSILNRTTELVGTATLPIYRCKGLGTAISAFTTKTAFQNGADIVCLSAADSKAGSIYSSIGFKKIATMLAYSQR